jgi:hypothetical protein
MTRQAVADDTVGGYRIPAKALSRRPDGYRGGRGDFLWGVALPALAATAVAGGDGRLGGVLDADRIVFWILPGENFLAYAREHGSVKNARNPFTAASPRDCCGLADTAAWQILRKIQVANACHFWRGGGWRITCGNVPRRVGRPEWVGRNARRRRPALGRREPGRFPNGHSPVQPRKGNVSRHGDAICSPRADATRHV